VIECGRDQYILDAAALNHIQLPSICRQGWCLTCAAKVLSGVVDDSAARVYYDEDRAACFALLCRGLPRSDLHLRTHAATEMRQHRKALGLPAPYA